ncbi:hypothetical protein AB0L13_23000 [Saccharopolyspora shandongensis]|uniref:Tc toxin subunit A-related protein n=1 Tax=Saccharopolyspora shandongensis TaxID=418495 RepID=UPI00343C6185
MAMFRYESEFFTCKPLAMESRALPGFAEPVFKAPEGPLETQVHGHVLAGNEAFVKGRHRRALAEYLAAWALLPRLVYPRFDDRVGDLVRDRLKDLDLRVELDEAAAAVHRWRPRLTDSDPLPLESEPNSELVTLTESAGGAGDVVAVFEQRAAAAAKTGDVDLTRRLADLALAHGGSDAELRGRATMTVGVAAALAGRASEALRSLEVARDVFKKSGNQSAVAAAEHNVGVLFTVSGDDKDALTRFGAAAAALPVQLGWQLTQSLNPGPAFSRPVGAAALGLLAPAASEWTTVASQVVATVPTNTFVMAGDELVEVDLGDRGESLSAVLYQPRIEKALRREIDAHLHLLPQFISYLSYVRGVVLPLALADCYAALGQEENAASYYLTVRDYEFLNHFIERPAVWARLANVYLRQGNARYRKGDLDGARERYEHIVARDANGTFVLDGPLYSGGFSDVTAEILAFLNAPDRATSTGLDYARRLVVMEALARVQQLDSGLNWLGFPDDVVPIHPWRYLQTVAQYFANQAIQAERAYVNFASTAEKGELERLQLQQAADAQDAAAQVEQRRVDLASEQQHAAVLGAELAAERITSAEDAKQDYAQTSQRQAYMDEILAFTNAGDRDVKLSQDWADALGIQLSKVKFGSTEFTLDTYKGYYLAQLLTRNRSQLTRDFELRNMDRKIDELKAAAGVAEAEAKAAARMTEVAIAQRDLADLRAEQAHAQLEFFDDEEFTPELWANLAQAQRELSRRYLDWAIGAAFLMERAYEFQYDRPVRRIRFDYERSELHGLLAGDFLLADINEFTYERLLETAKPIPVKVAISLADRFPYQFYQHFQKTGRIDVQSTLDDLDRRHPGSFVRSLRRVEVVVEGLVGPEGLSGTLTNTGVSADRGRDGRSRLRVQKPETMLLSRFEPRGDAFAFTVDGEQVLGAFEYCGAASGWILDFPPENNDIDYQAITNVHLVLYFEAFYSQEVARVVRAELAAGESNQHSFGTGLAFDFPDEFFALGEAGAVEFTLDAGRFPLDQLDPRVTDLHLALVTEKGTDPGGLVVRLEQLDEAVTVDQTTDADGLISTSPEGGPAAPLDVLRGKPLTGRWRLAIDHDANQARFDAGFRWDAIRNVMLFAEYTFTPRGRRAVGDDFATNPMASFEVVDDPAATEDAPSSWQWDGAATEVTQTSNIHGSGAPPPADPATPGTYLVHEAGVAWPELGDLVLGTRFTAGGGGIGLVFRWRDKDNFSFVLLDGVRGVRRIGKKVAGTFQDLSTAAVDLNAGYAPGTPHELRVAAVGDVVTACLDGEQVLTGRDGDSSVTGRVGLLTTGNPTARFHDIHVREL